MDKIRNVTSIVKVLHICGQEKSKIEECYQYLSRAKEDYEWNDWDNIEIEFREKLRRIEDGE
jgi:hypothetical protein